MTITPLPERPEERVVRPRLDRSQAEELGARIQQQAAVIAEATCELLLMVTDFDERAGVGWFVGLKSTAHWLAWACSMTPGTAREHVRVARTLPTMPLTVAGSGPGGCPIPRSERSPAWPTGSRRPSSWRWPAP